VSALIIGTAIALIAVAFVLVPLFRDDAGEPAPAPHTASRGGSSGDDAVSALREIEFDRATGKLSDADYAVLKARYTSEAIDAMRAADSAAITPEASDLAEQAILRYRKRAMGCEVCGPRPEPDALYCSTCGRYLPGRCNGCGAAVSEPAARFCASCGRTLAA
jgi:rRNA maturation endonuclease Nob1